MIVLSKLIDDISIPITMNVNRKIELGYSRLLLPNSVSASIKTGSLRYASVRDFRTSVLGAEVCIYFSLLISS
jgi:hypothetical protein